MREPITGRSLVRIARLIAATVLVSLSMASYAADAVKDPLNYPLRQYGLVLAVALLGGLASWVAKVRGGTVQAWSLMSLVGELCVSALAGLLCFWLCEWRDFSPLLTASLVGIAGHMGTRALMGAEKVLEKRFGATGNGVLDEPK